MPLAATDDAAADTPDLRALRARMVETQIEPYGVRDPRVLAAMRTVPRHAFIGEAYRDMAYADTPLPIGGGQTISQPFIVAAMTELARIEPGDKVLEIGTGCGYQAAVLAELGADVHSIEIVPALARSARRRLQALGYAANVREGDGYAGWPEAAPFDAIIVAVAPPSVPPPLREQLAIGGRLVILVGDIDQDLVVITRTAAGYEEWTALPVSFVPMVGEVRRAQDR